MNISLTEDLLEELNRLVVSQQRQIDQLQQELSSPSLRVQTVMPNVAVRVIVSDSRHGSLARFRLEQKLSVGSH